MTTNDDSPCAGCFAIILETTYCFPFNEIISIDGATLKLVNNLQSYIEHPVTTNRPATGNTFEYHMTNLSNPSLFQKVVLAFKQHHRDTRMATRELSLSESDIELVATAMKDEEKPTKEMLRALQEQLKRQNDLLEASMRSDDRMIV